MRGYRASTMEVIARETGYSRGNIYRLFPTRESLMDALALRIAQQYIARIPERLPDDAAPVSLLVEGMVILATELVDDLLFKTISEQFEGRTVAHLLAQNSEMTSMIEQVMQRLLQDDATRSFRPNLHPKDLAQFFISTAISMLSGNIPGIENPDTARRYIDAFVLPAIVVKPPPVRRVFEEQS
jgi:AcrR family transcriptional regulator